MTAQSEQGLTIVVLHHDTDSQYLEQFERHLSALSHQQLITVWHRGKLTAGDEVGEGVREHIRTADLILLFISAEFVADCEEVVTFVLETYERSNIRVVPVPIRHCHWSGHPFFGRQPIPKDGQPLVISGRMDDARCAQAADEIRRLIAVIGASPRPELTDRDHTIPSTMREYAVVYEALERLHARLSHDSSPPPRINSVRPSPPPPPPHGDPVSPGPEGPNPDVDSHTTSSNENPLADQFTQAIIELQVRLGMAGDTSTPEQIIAAVRAASARIDEERIAGIVTGYYVTRLQRALGLGPAPADRDALLFAVAAAANWIERERMEQDRMMHVLIKGIVSTLASAGGAERPTYEDHAARSPSNKDRGQSTTLGMRAQCVRPAIALPLGIIIAVVAALVTGILTRYGSLAIG